MKRIVFIILLFYAIPLTQTQAVVVLGPDNFIMPESTGKLFSFDIIVLDPIDDPLITFTARISVSRPGTLTFDASNSEAVEDDPDYWLYLTNVGAGALDKGCNSYEFADNPYDPPSEVLVAGDIVARYAFTWDGTEGDYTFTLDPDILNSFVQLDDFVSKEALQLPGGEWYSYPIVSADAISFTVHIPEPTTMMLLALGGMVLLRKRNA